MKYLISILISLSFAVLSFGQTTNVTRFMNSFHKSENTTKISIPGFLIRTGVFFAKSFIEDDDETKMALEFTRKVKSLKLLVVENKDVLSTKAYNELISNIKEDNFEELIKVRDGDTNVNLFVIEKNNVIKNLLILVDETDEFVMLNLKTKMDYEDINHIVQTIQNEGSNGLIGGIQN